MTLARTNPHSRFTPAIQPLLADPNGRYVLMDIGARGGMSPVWEPLEPLADFIGFEPDLAECDRLNDQFQRQGRTRSRIYPRAIAGRTGLHRFHVTQLPYSSGLYRGNDVWLERFPFTTLKVMREVQVEAVTLDHFCGEAAIDHVDFVKIDVEGAECDVLEGARDTLSSRRVLGIMTEFWWDPVIKGQRAFAEIDIFLRDQGFRFFDLQLHRYARSTLPAGHLQEGMDPNGRKVVMPRVDIGYGQAWTGDALYFRDPVGEVRGGRRSIAWDRETLLRLCGLLDVFDYGDCALEVLETFRTTVLDGVDVDALMDALVPTVHGVAIGYGEYRDLSITVRQSFNRRAFGLSDWLPPATGYRKER